MSDTPSGSVTSVTTTDEAGDRPANAWSITGLTEEPGGRQLAAAVWSQGTTGRRLLATAPVSADGRFSIGFAAEDLQPGVADFVVAILDSTTGSIGKEALILDAKREEVLSTSLALPAAPMSYPALRDAVIRVLIERAEVEEGADPEEELRQILDDAPPAAVDGLADKAGVNVVHLRQLQRAVRAPLIGLPLPVAYALALADLALDVETLTQADDEVTLAIQRAVADNTIDAKLIGAGQTDPAEHVVGLLDKLSSQQVLDRPVVAGGSAVSDLLDIAVGGLSADEQASLAALTRANDVFSDDFWTALDTARWRTKADRAAFRHVLWLDTVTLSSLPMVRHLADLERSLTVEVALGLRVEDWKSHMQQAGSQAAPSVPERFRTGSTNAQRTSYAAAIMSALRLANRESAARVLVAQVTSQSIEDEQPNPVAALAQALADDAAVDVLAPLADEDDDAPRQRRLIVRALTDGGANPVAMVRELASEAYAPPLTVARMGKRAFTGSEETYRHAAFANAALLSVYSDLRATAAAPRAEDRTDLPDWSEQFGQIDDTKCEHCSSVYSPSAYLVDLLRFARDRGLGDELLAPSRRPDLESIKLNCVNTNTTLPYIDLVNEILESAVLSTTGDKVELPPVAQTTVTDQGELRAHPEHLTAAAYDVVRDAVYPFSTPFDLWEAEARAYLGLAEVDRGEVRRIVAGGSEDTAADQLGLYPSDLAILDGTAEVAPAYNARGYKADANILRLATGLTFEQLAEVLGTGYLQGDDDQGPELDLTTEPETITAPFGVNHARRLHRMLLLHRRLDLTVGQLDRTLGVIGGQGPTGALSATSVADLAAMRRLATELSLSLDQVSALFESSVRTVVDGDGRSDYDDWFGKPTGTEDRPPAVFTLTADRSALAEAGALVADNDSELRTALALDVTQFGLLQELTTPELTLTSMADLIRWTMLSRALKLSIRQLRIITEVSGIEPFVLDGGRLIIAQTERFVQAARAAKDAGLKPEGLAAVLLNPVTATELADEASPAAALAAKLLGKVALAETTEDRASVLLETAAEALKIDEATAAVLLSRTMVFSSGASKTIEEVLLGDSADFDVIIAADRLAIAAALVQALALPSTAVGLLFDPATEWLDPNFLPLSVSDLSTEMDRADVVVETAAAVVRAEPDGTASIPISITVDGASPDPASVSWRVIGEPQVGNTAGNTAGVTADITADAAGAGAGGAWTAAVTGAGELTLVATVATDQPGHAAGIGALTINVRAFEDWPQRTEDGLLSLYQFHEGSGSTVTDISSVGDPMNLTIDGDTSWIADGGLVVRDGTMIQSDGPATKIIDAVIGSGEITIEAWITPAEAEQYGPARIATISDGALQRNVTLGHEGRTVVGRFRTSTTGENGNGPATTSGSVLTSELTHVVYTRQADGGRLYVNGVLQAHEQGVAGATDGWSSDMAFALAGEFGDEADRQWRGTYHLVALYKRALSDEEVDIHRSAGPLPPIESPVVQTGPGQATMLAWDASTTEVDLDGTVTAERPDLVSADWTMVSGPAPVSFLDGMDLATSARFSATGEYLLGLRAQDQRDPKGWAQATVSVRVAADPDGIPARWQRFARALTFSDAAYSGPAGLTAQAAADTAANDGTGTDGTSTDSTSTGSTDSSDGTAGSGSTGGISIGNSAGTRGETVEPPLFAVLAATAGQDPDTRLTRDFIDHLGRATGLGPRIDVLLADDELGAETFGQCRNGERIVRIAAAAALALKTGSTPRKLLDWADARIDSDEAGEIKAAVRSTFTRERWMEAAGEVRDVLREQQRDALVAHLLHRGTGNLTFGSTDDIYGRFLIDTEMSSCQLTSRMKQAISSVQQFVQRTLLGIEQGVELSSDDAGQWKWMKSYRLWEANRKVFLHPENWIEPELRNDKSPFFADLERELAQAELTDAAAERALANYLRQLDSVANLEIVGVCQEHDGSRAAVPQVLHVIGRSRSRPKTHWHRTLTGGVDWSPWRQIDADIGGDHVIPVFHSRRLFVFWAEFEPKDEAPADPKNADGVARRFASCSLSFTELRDGEWTPKVLSDGAALYLPILEDGGAVTFPNDTASGTPDFSSFSFEVSSDAVSNDLTIEVGYRSGPTMLIWPGFEMPGSGTGLRPRTGDARRLPTDRPTNNDRHESFGFASDSTTALQALALPEAGTGRLIPALNTDRADTLTYTAVCTSAPPVPQFVFQQFKLIWSLAVADVRRWVAQAGPDWAVTFRDVQNPVPRIHPRPPATFSHRLEIRGIPEDRRPEVEATLRAKLRGWPVRFVRESQQAQPRLVNLLNEVSPPWSAVASRRMDLAFDRGPFVFQDRLAGFLVAPSDRPAAAAAELTVLTNPLVADLRRALERSGVDGLLAPPSGDPLRHQAAAVAIGTSGAYRSSHVAGSPTAELDFDVAGAFSAYHWELFFHVPFLIAKLLTRNQRFDEAQRWLHFIFDPTAASKRGAERGEPWQIKPLRRKAMAQAADDLRLVLQGGPASVGDEPGVVRRRVDFLLGEIHDNPFDPHVVARLRTSAYKKAVVMAYLDNLIAWADQLFTRDTLESINEAAQLYVMAADILGPRPAQKPADDAIDLTAAELEAADPPEAITRTLTQISPSSAVTLGRGGQVSEPPAITLELSFCMPANPKLLGYWDVIADRLHKVRHCQNIEGIERALALFARPIDPGALLRAAAAGTGGAGSLTGAPVKAPHHRFTVMHGRAVAAAHQVRLFGGTLSNALQTRDSTVLEELLSAQNVAGQRGTRSLLALRKREAERALEAVEQSRAAIQAHKEFVDGRADETDLEAAAFGLETAGVAVKTVSGVLHQVAGAIGLAPEILSGGAGLASPVVVIEYGGSKIGRALDQVATGMDTLGAALDGSASLVANRADLQRRKADFDQEKAQAAIELARIEKEVEAASTAVAIANDDIATLEAVIRNAEAVDQHLRTRFTDAQLWNNLVSRASEIYFQSYSVALDLARRAERACQLELGDEESFISAANWDSLRKGLLSGEGLLVDLTRMEAAYLESHRREYELSLPIRVGELGGRDALRRDGVVDVSIPERSLDRRTPGHYLRRIKSVAVTVQGRNGPLDIPAKVTLLRSSVRVSTDVNDGYGRTGPEDSRFRDEAIPTSIVTSGDREDTGLFVREYDDDRYLPFEGAGLAGSMWRIDLFPDTGVDRSEVVDVELTIDYTARDGGDEFRRSALTL